MAGSVARSRKTGADKKQTKKQRPYNTSSGLLAIFANLLI
jgi:hypothetical protein